MFNNASSKILALILLIATFVYSQEELLIFTKNSKTGIQALSKNQPAVKIKKKLDNMVVVEVPKDINKNKFISMLEKDNNVALVIPNFKIKPQLIPNDTYFNYQWYLKKISADRGWDISTGSNTLYIAVIDTGININHPDIKDNIFVNTGEYTNQDSNNNGIDDGCENNVDDDNNGYVDDCFGFDAVNDKGSAIDEAGHGTHVAGLIGAIGNNNEGIAGLNWQIKIIPCKFIGKDTGDYADEIQCLKYVKDIVNQKNLNLIAINASYGYEGDAKVYNIDCSKTEYQDTEKCLIKSFNNVLYITASGNGGFDYNGDNVDPLFFLPCKYSLALDNVICVGSTNNNDKISKFSNYSPESVNIFAPGGDLTDAGCNENVGIVSLWINENGKQYACAVGTSQATPLVAGAIALLKSSNPSLDLNQLKNKILTTGDNLITLSGYSSTCNRLNVYNALSNETSPKICIDQHIKEENGEYIYDFGTVSYAISKKFTIKNTGNKPLEIGQITISKGIFKILSTDCNNKSLNTFQTCSIIIEVPYISSGQVSSILSIPTNTKYSTLNIKLIAKGNEVVVSSSGGNSGGGCNFHPQNKSGIYIILILLLILKTTYNRWKN